MVKAAPTYSITKYLVLFYVFMVGKAIINLIVVKYYSILMATWETKLICQVILYLMTSLSDTATNVPLSSASDPLTEELWNWKPQLSG